MQSNFTQKNEVVEDREEKDRKSEEEKAKHSGVATCTYEATEATALVKISSFGQNLHCLAIKVGYFQSLII